MFPQRTPKQTNPESKLLASILSALQLVYKHRAHFWRNNTGATKTASGGFLRYGEKGSADILGLISPSGRLVALEVKQPGKKPTQAQREWADEIKRLGGWVATVTSIDEALQAVEQATTPTP